jgi:Plasmid pRiA4b ORF-3-like protein
MVTRKRLAPRIYELNIVLEDIEPAIWRRILVPTTITLPKLHDVLQSAMGWTNSHLHFFAVGNRRYTVDDGELEQSEMLDESKHTLEGLLGSSLNEFEYVYDFGDNWRHHIVVKRIAKPQPDWFYPLCIAGARATPPEDVGGTGGYDEFLLAINDPDDDEHDSMLVWAGGVFDPEGFDVNAINRALRDIAECPGN